MFLGTQCPCTDVAFLLTLLTHVLWCHQLMNRSVYRFDWKFYSFTSFKLPRRHRPNRAMTWIINIFLVFLNSRFPSTRKVSYKNVRWTNSVQHSFPNYDTFRAQSELLTFSDLVFFRNFRINHTNVLKYRLWKGLSF